MKYFEFIDALWTVELISWIRDIMENLQLEDVFKLDFFTNEIMLVSNDMLLKKECWTKILEKMIT